MVKADFAKSLTHLGVATVLLAGITVSLAQGYHGFLALQDPPVPAPLNQVPVAMQSSENMAGQPASSPTAHQAASDLQVATRASATSSQAQGERWPVQRAVWRKQPPVHSVPAAQRDPRSMLRSPLPASAWPGFRSNTPARLQRPAYPARTYARPTAVRSGFGSLAGPRVSGKACGMGFG